MLLLIRQLQALSLFFEGSILMKCVQCVQSVFKCFGVISIYINELTSNEPKKIWTILAQLFLIKVHALYIE